MSPEMLLTLSHEVGEANLRIGGIINALADESDDTLTPSLLRNLTRIMDELNSCQSLLYGVALRRRDDRKGII